MLLACPEYDPTVPFVQGQYEPTVLLFRNEKRTPYAPCMDFGARLRSARKAKNLSQEDLGKGLGVSEPDVSKQTVYGWEKNKHHPTARQLALICERLGVSADLLLFGKSAGEDMKSLNGLEAQLVMMFRGLGEFEQDEILQLANMRLNESSVAPTPGNPFPGKPITGQPASAKQSGQLVTSSGYTGPERRKVKS